MTSPVVSKPKPNSPLDRETVARAALRVVDEVGLDALTMRRLATELDIQNPSLYWYFASKQELLGCMAALMFADGFADLHPLRPGQDWADWLADYGRIMRRIMLSHRDGARILAEANSYRDDFFVGVELVLEGLQETGFGAHTTFAAVAVVTSYVLGNTFEAQADPVAPQGGEADKSSDSLRPTFDAARFPLIAALVYPNAHSPAVADEIFEEGLSLILDGLRTKLAKERQHGSS